ncbi:MAG TPA: response regulator [Anaerolineae bacterium]|nr:response regulator [Anaerolineae bacterium]
MPKKVLIADDEANIVLSLEFLMKKAGYEIRVARNGEEALAEVTSFDPDLVLLDIMMPKINGFDVCQRIRANPDYNHVKIVMLTAKGREVEITRGLDLGADSYIVKPFSTRELLAEVQRLIGEL